MHEQFLRQVPLSLGFDAVVLNSGNDDTDIFSIAGADQIDFYVYTSAATTLTFTLSVSDLATGSEVFQDTSSSVLAGVETLTAATVVYVAAGAARFHFGYKDLNGLSAKLNVASSGAATVTVRGLAGCL